MLPQSIAITLMRLRELYAKYEKAARFVGNVTVVSSLLKGDDSVLATRYKHDSSDQMSAAYLFTLLGLQLERESQSLDSVNSATLNTFLESGGKTALIHILEQMKRHPSDASVNDTVQSASQHMIRAYVRFLAPRWDSALASYFLKEKRHAIVEAYIEAYHNLISSSAEWKLILRTNTDKLTDEAINEQLAHLFAMSKQDAVKQDILSKLQGTRTDWYGYLPTAMYLASAHSQRALLLIPRNLELGQMWARLPPLILNGPASYSEMRRPHYNKAFTPPRFLIKTKPPENEDQE